MARIASLTRLRQTPRRLSTMAHKHAAHDEFLKAQFASLPPLPATDRLSPAVIRILGGNPGKFSLQGTNTYLVGTGPSRILIDTGQGIPVWAATLAAVLAAEAATIHTALLTHRHHDHVGGIADLLAMSPATAVHKHAPDGGGDGAQQPIRDGQEFAVEGATLRAIHTPGHTADHTSFYLAEERALFTGDTVLGHGTTVFEDLAAYMRSLQALQDACAARLYPAHGAVVEDARAKLAEYVRHRKLREGQIVRVLEQRRGERGVGSMEIVKSIYRDVSADLHRAAEGGTVQVLEKLQGEGRVGRDEDGDGTVRWFLKEPLKL